jgi:transposase
MLLPSLAKIYMAAEPVDLRRGHEGLCAVVRTQLGGDPYEGHLFVFVGRRFDRIKILFWDRGGFVLYSKRLERGRFRMPRIPHSACQMELDGTALEMLLDGIDVQHVRRASHWQPRTSQK